MRFGFVGVGEEDVNVGSVGRGDRREELAGDDGAGESGLGPVEDELGLAARSGVLPGDAAADGAPPPAGTVTWISAVKRSV